MSHYEVRCPCLKPHTINGVEYETCGTLLGGVDDMSTAYYRCPTCGWIKVVSNEEDGLSLTVLGRDRIDFIRTWRRIINEQ